MNNKQIIKKLKEELAQERKWRYEREADKTDLIKRRQFELEEIRWLKSVIEKAVEK